MRGNARRPGDWDAERPGGGRPGGEDAGARGQARNSAGLPGRCSAALRMPRAVAGVRP